MNKLRFIYNSISFKVFLVIIVILTPLISMLVYYNYQSRETLLEQTKGTHRNMLRSYMNQIDAQLSSTMGYTLDMVLFKDDPMLLVASEDESTVVFAKSRIFNDMSNRLISSNLISALFLYVKSQDYFLMALQQGTPLNESEALKEYVRTIVSQENKYVPRYKSKWAYALLSEKNCLVNISYGNNDIICGAYTSTDRILRGLSRKTEATYPLSLISYENLVQETRKLPEKNLLITSRSSVLDLYLTETLPEESILSSLPFVQKYVLLVSIVLICMLPILIYLMNLIVVNPLNQLIRSMIKIHNGNLSHRIQPKRSSNEFEIVNNTFNEMMDEVQNLKINVYEEQIKVQRSQLRNLQLQIKPHFLINSLNMVNNLIENEKLAAAREMILYSVYYFRFMAKVDNDFVTLNEEIKHVNNYLKIQKIRYADKLDYAIEANRLIEDMLIPPMLIQNFVENSIKYAIQMDKILYISVRIEYFEIDYYPHARIIISDTGTGYPAEMLENLNAGEKVADSLGEHIGIYNSVQRLKILYNGRAGWNFYNNGGAVSEITIPALFE